MYNHITIADIYILKKKELQIQTKERHQKTGQGNSTPEGLPKSELNHYQVALRNADT